MQQTKPVWLTARRLITFDAIACLHIWSSLFRNSHWGDNDERRVDLLKTQNESYEHTHTRACTRSPQRTEADAGDIFRGIHFLTYLYFPSLIREPEKEH